MRFSLEASRVLDFDIENRPLSYLGSDFTTGEVTAIAWQYVDEPSSADAAILGITCQHPHCSVVHYGETLAEILDRFVRAYNDADVVTGHYITGHDLPVINGALLELSLPALQDKLVSDTKQHLLKRRYISASQENLAEMLGVRAPKVHMNTPRWREANRLTPEGLAITKKRVVGDVRQHIQLRKKLIELGWLGPARLWTSGSSGGGKYAP